jgi:hypothetical protein
MRVLNLLAVYDLTSSVVGTIFWPAFSESWAIPLLAASSPDINELVGLWSNWTHADFSNITLVGSVRP